jgi:threonine dehydratase
VQKNAEDVLLVSDAELAEAMKVSVVPFEDTRRADGRARRRGGVFNKLPANIRRIGVVISGGNVDADALCGSCSSRRGHRR